MHIGEVRNLYPTTCPYCNKAIIMCQAKDRRWARYDFNKSFTGSRHDDVCTGHEQRKAAEERQRAYGTYWRIHKDWNEVELGLYTALGGDD